MLGGVAVGVRKGIVGLIGFDIQEKTGTRDPVPQDDGDSRRGRIPEQRHLDGALLPPCKFDRTYFVWSSWQHVNHSRSLD